jgi:hypothetical protein
MTTIAKKLSVKGSVRKAQFYLHSGKCAIDPSQDPGICPSLRPAHRTQGHALAAACKGQEHAQSHRAGGAHCAARALRREV